MENKNDIREKRENPLISITFNIIIPVIILAKFTSVDQLGPIYGLIAALAFPTCYFIYDLISKKKTNFISIIGFISIFLTGIIGVFEFPSEWIAFKEASVPLIIGIAVLVSLKTPFPLVKKLLYNKDILDTDKINNVLKEQNKEKIFNDTLIYSTYMLAASFLLSSILNFTLAKILIKSPTGTEAFTQELAKMTALSYPVIALPSTIVMLLALWYLFHSIKKLTGLSMEELFAEHLREKVKE
jgi:hypothetical protein